jgi:hypothetical protein
MKSLIKFIEKFIYIQNTEYILYEKKIMVNLMVFIWQF